MRKYWCFVKATWLSGFLQAIQYPFNYFLRIVRIPVALYFLYIGTHIFQGTYNATWKLKNTHYFYYVLLGSLVLMPCLSSVEHIPRRIGRILCSGRLATMWSLPHSEILLLGENVFLAVIAKYFMVLIMIILIGCLQGMNVSFFSCLFIALSLALCTGIYFCFGIIASAILLIVRRGDIIASAIVWLSTYFTGVFVPTKVLPEWSRIISPLVPITHCLKITRNTLAGEIFSKETLFSFLSLSLTMVITFYFSRIVFRYSIKYLKISGALTRY